MSIAAVIEELNGAWIPAIYRDKVRTQRTRSYEMQIPDRENNVEILFTLLGIELRVGKWRFACPDLATARYLSVFARVGCSEVAIPYDITRISVLADELEVAWQNMVLIHVKTTAKLSPQARGRIRAGLLRELRKQIDEVGAGEKMPDFKSGTTGGIASK